MSVTTINYGLTPIDTLSISLIGNATAHLSFDFHANIITVSSLHKMLLQHADTDFKKHVDNIIKKSTLFKVNLPSPTLIDKTTLTIPNGVSTNINQLQSSKVRIQGSATLTNDSPIPVTVKIFAETVTVGEGAKARRIINTNKLMLGYVDTSSKSRIMEPKMVPLALDAVSVSIL